MQITQENFDRIVLAACNATASVHTLLAENAGLRTQINTIQQDVIHLRETDSTQHSEINKLRTKVISLEKQNGESQDEIAKLKGNCRTLIAEQQNSYRQNDRLRANFELLGEKVVEHIRTRSHDRRNTFAGLVARAREVGLDL